MRISSKMLLLMSGVTGLVVAGMLAALVPLERRQFLREEREQMDSTMAAISRAAAESISQNDDLALLSYLRFQMKEQPALELCLVTHNGYTTVLGKMKSELEYRTVSGSSGDGTVTVQAGFSKDLMRAKLRAENTALATVALGVAVVGLAIGFAGALWISRRIASPVAELARAAEDFGAGRLETKVEPQGALEIRRLDMAFNDMAEKIRESVRAKEDLLSTLTHELNNPLAGLKAYIALLRDPGRIATIAESRQAYETMAEAVGQMELTLSNALELFRTSAKPDLDPEVVELGDLAREVVSLYGPVARANHIELKLEAPAHGLALMADRKLVRRVMINLVSNALKYTPERGSIAVTLAERAGCVDFSVADTGYGISKEDQQHLFTKFYRTRGADGRKSKIPGSGLGLAIVKQAVELHRGKVRVESEKGKGSTFIVSLPKSETGECV